MKHKTEYQAMVRTNRFPVLSLLSYFHAIATYVVGSLPKDNFIEKGVQNTEIYVSIFRLDHDIPVDCFHEKNEELKRRATAANQNHEFQTRLTYFCPTS